jgi:membrane associated rhomboid family serine protease
MGLYDRQYIRRDTGQFRARVPGSPVRSSLGGWSVTTWLITINIVVFIVGGFLPWVPADYRPVDIPVGYELTGAETSATTVAVGNPGGPVFTPLYAYEDGPRIGHVEARPMLEEVFHFSTSKGFLQIEFWRFITFQFQHAGFWHVLLNMIGLYFFGPLVEQYLGGKRYLAFYLLCGIFGAVMYLILNLGGYVATEIMNISVPGLLVNRPDTPLIGASAGVFGILMAGAYLAPQAKVLLWFFLPMRLTTLAWLLVGISIVAVLTAGDNAGGEAAHLGGALAGFYFIRRPHHLHGFFDVLGRVDPTSKNFAGRRGGQGGSTSQATIDRILDKISRQGLHSLTSKEKKQLHDASRSSRSGDAS